MIRVGRFSEPDELPAREWDDVVAAAGAPLFYRHRFLTALSRNPLYATLDRRFVVVEAGTSAVGVLPVYRVQSASPITSAAGAAGAVWVSHLAHWYDSRLPFTSTPQEAVAVLPRVLAEAGIDELVLQNVGSTALLEALRDHGCASAESDTRYARDLTGIGDRARWLAGLGDSTRRNVRRVLRRADAAGWRRSVLPAGDADLPAVVGLCRRSTAIHGNPEWLPAEITAGFIDTLREDVVVHEVRDGSGALVAAAVGFHDGGTYHSWSGGIAPQEDRDPGIDANLLLYVCEHDHALGAGLARIEGGRRSGELKQRLGMRPIPLHTAVVTAA